MRKTGIMQGRLSPPTEGKFQSFPKFSWREEFHKASKAGLKSIEWIFEADEWEENPISSNDGINEISELIKETGIIIESVCADYFMDIPYFKANHSVRKDHRERLKWLITQATNIGAKYIDLPFVDASKVEHRDHFDLIFEFVKPALVRASELDLTIALETNLDPKDFKFLLEKINHPHLQANYDTGNSSGLGYDCVEELNYYGKWIKTIHIKNAL